MSLAARCPHCQTVFRITGAQLAAAQGWVRCGHCSQVFDAASNLATPQGQALEVPTVDTAVPPAASWTSTANPTAPEIPASPNIQALPDIDLELPDLGPLKAEAEAKPDSASLANKPPLTAQSVDEPVVVPSTGSDPAAPAPAAAPARDLREPFWTEPQATPSGMVAADESPRPSAASTLQGATSGSPSAEGPAAGTSAPDPVSADRRPPGADRWTPNAPSSATRPATAAWWAVIALSLSLTVMVAYAMRAHLAQTWPEARPLVMQLCQAFGCTLPPLRLIEAVSIEGSSLSYDDEAAVHRLRLVVRHQGDWPAQMPAFDLSLLDENRQVLARRMIDPTEFENPQAILDRGAEITLSLVLNLRGIEAASVGSFQATPYYP